MFVCPSTEPAVMVRTFAGLNHSALLNQSGKCHELSKIRSDLGQSKCRGPEDLSLLLCEPETRLGNKRSTRRRAIITNAIAKDIFSLKHQYFGSRLHCQSSSLRTRPTNHSIEVSRLYGISPKAVRDIWNGFAAVHLSS